MNTKRTLIVYILMMFVCLSSLNAEEGSSQPGSTSDPIRIIKVIGIKDVKIRRSPIPSYFDVLLTYDDTEVNVFFRGDFGIVDYQLTNTDTEESFTGTVDTSFNDRVTIPMQISESFNYDFQIVFEDGSWCHVTF